VDRRRPKGRVRLGSGDTEAALRPKLEGRPQEVLPFEKRGIASWSSPELEARIASILKK
jgi:hypothetical protein